jgi:two-component system chemotaxis response regulator CheY
MATDVSVKGVRVLIVDDASAVRSLLHKVLEAEGYLVVGQLASGTALMETIVKTSPDLVCLDYHMPGENGMALLKQVHEAHPQVSVVMITGDHDHGLEDVAADAGAQGFIVKPFALSKLTQDLAQVVRARQLLAQIRNTPHPAQDQPPIATAVIADDSATMRLLLTNILQSVHIKVLGAASDGKQAVTLVNAQRPDLVCLDWDMPVMNGLEALRFIRASQPKAHIVMITGRADREAIVAATQAGAKGYVLKPFHPERVITTISKVLA